MPNSYFKFKQFTVNQEHCAMKVCTDACIFGAWFANKMPPYASILDIGSGTGLLMLMIAQKSQGEIHGIEIELDAFRQLKENIQASPWTKRLKGFPGDAKSFSFPHTYDFIISNPPFFENDLLSESDSEQVAKHSRHLTFIQLLETIQNNLNAQGNFGVLLPYHRQEEFLRLAETFGFFPREQLALRHSSAHTPFRCITYFVRKKEEFSPIHELIIYKEDKTYTREFKELLKEYYLYL